MKPPKRDFKSVTDAEGTTFILCKKTNKITSYRDKKGIIYDANGKKIGKL